MHLSDNQESGMCDRSQESWTNISTNCRKSNRKYQAHIFNGLTQEPYTLMTDSDSLPTSKKEFRELDPYYFEQLIAVIWEKLGYDTTVRSGSHDRGMM